LAKGKIIYSYYKDYLGEKKKKKKKEEIKEFTYEANLFEHN
jgi:hypothetical protein